MKKILLFVFVLIVLLSPLYSRSQGLIACYTFSGNANDSSGNGNNGTLEGGATANGVLSIGNNVQDYMILPTNILNNIGDFTISFKINFNSFNVTGNSPPTNHILAGDNGSLGLYPIFGMAYQKDIDSWTLTVNGINEYFFSDQPAIQTWYCMLLTRHNGTIKLFRDGTQIGDSMTDNSVPAIQSLLIGQETDCLGGCFDITQCMNGSLDNLQFYSQAASSLLISDMCNDPCQTFQDTCHYLQTYDTSIGWINHGVGMSVANGVLQFTNVIGASDNRIEKQMINLHDSAWSCNFQFVPQAIDGFAGGAVELVSFTSDSDYPWRVPAEGAYTNNSFIEVSYISDPHYGATSFNLIWNTKLPNDTPYSDRFGMIPNAIQIPPAAFNQTYYCHIQRLSPTLGTFSVYHDAAHTQPLPNSPQCFPIPAGIVNLHWLQHGVLVQAGNDRSFTGTVDNVDIQNCVQPIAFHATPKTVTTCTGDTVQLHAHFIPDTLSGVTYQWSPAAGLSCSNCQNTTVTAGQSSEYIVTAFLPGGCSLSDTVDITISCPQDSCHYVQTYDNSNGWINHGAGMSVTNGVLQFTNVIGASDNRIEKQMINLHDSAWSSDFQFVPQAIDPFAGGAVELVSFTSDSDYPWRVPALGAYTNNSFIEVSYISLPHYGATTFNLIWNTKLPNDTPYSDRFGMIPNAIQIPPAAFNQTYYCHIQRLSPTMGTFSVYHDAAHTQPLPNSPQCFPIPAGIVNLHWLQHGVLVQAGDDRSFTGTVDNLDVLNCLQPIAFRATPKTVTTCTGDTVQLHAHFIPDTLSGVTYQWTPAAGLSCSNCQNTTATAGQNSQYIVTAFLPGGCSLSDTININLNSIAVQATVSSKPVYCSGDTIQLHAHISPDTLNNVMYQWTPSGGLTCTNCADPVANPDSSVTYTVIASTPSKCSASDTVTVKIQTLNLTASSANICIGDSAQLNSTVFPDTLNGVSYLWSPSATLNCTACPNPIADPSSTTKYYITVTTVAGCSVKDSTIVQVRFADTISIAVSPSSTITAGDSVHLVATGGFNYTWTPPTGLSCTNCPNPVAKPDSTTTYFVMSNDGKCSSEDTITILVLPVCKDLALPSAFTPNGDGHNDIYHLLFNAKGNLLLKYFRIYNRWGQVVFDTDNFSLGWDGKFEGKPEPIGTYIWIVDAICNGKEIFQKGNVTLLR